MYFIYIIHSEIAHKYYVGYTTNANLRLRQHNEQNYFNTYTSKFRPWHLSALFSCGDDEATAIMLERFIKKQHSRKLIEKLCDPIYIPDGQLAQLVRVPDVRD